MFNWYKKVVFDNYANFKGRARCAEFWYFVLFNIIFAISAYLIDTFLNLNFEPGAGGPFYLLYILGVFVPGLAVTVRRLHDLNKSGWYFLLVLIPLIGGIWFLVLLSSEGTRGNNSYGLDPKQNQNI